MTATETENTQAADHKTRARHFRNELGAPLEVLAVRLPSSVQRTPRVAVDLALGPVALVLTVARKRIGNRLEIRLPETSDGAPGVMLPPELQAEAEDVAVAAVRANPEAWHHLLGRGR
jgi:hypothetical protein